MTNKNIGFIGSGRITRIFLEGWRPQGPLPPNIVVSDCNAETLAKLKARYPSIETVLPSEAAAQDLVSFQFTWRSWPKWWPASKATSSRARWWSRSHRSSRRQN